MSSYSRQQLLALAVVALLASTLLTQISFSDAGKKKKKHLKYLAAAFLIGRF